MSEPALRAETREPSGTARRGAATQLRSLTRRVNRYRPGREVPRRHPRRAGHASAIRSGHPSFDPTSELCARFKQIELTPAVKVACLSDLIL